MKTNNKEPRMSKRERRNKWIVRIFTLFLVAVMLAGTFYYTIIFIKRFRIINIYFVHWYDGF